MVASNDSSEEPASKKAKTRSTLCGGVDGDGGGESLAVARLIDTAWEHYRNYVDNEEDDEGGGGETDELAELLEILRDVVSPPTTPGESTRPPVTATGASTTASSSTCMPITSRMDLLPVLISVAHCVLADHAISDLLQQQTSSPLSSPSSQETKDASTSSIHNTSDDEVRQQIHQHLHNSLVYFPDNAAAWSMAANYVRMMLSTSSSSSSSTLFLASVYARAADKARAVRQRAIALLLKDDEDSDADESQCCKEWIELLLLNQVAGVELMEEEDDEEKEDDPEDNDDEEEEKEDCWTSSAVEGTARFMAAMLFSMAEKHDAAARQLQHFPAMTHRLHPNIWKQQQQQQQASLPVPSSSSSSSLTSPRTTTTPVSFQSPTGILPAHLYERLCQVFHPDAPYWTESDYANRGYYSYFMDLLPDNDKSFTPRNLIEDVVCNHLLPLAQQQQQQLSKQSKDSTTDDDDDDTQQPATIVGYEWWVHTRPISANLGHNLHFDTDEALLAQDKIITHPVVSSVLYLTGGGAGGGATIVLDQTPDAQTNAESAWLARPVDNSFMTFPGNLLHGVLPCPGTGGAGSKLDDDDDDSSGASSVSATNGTSKDDTMLSTISKLWNDQSSPSSLSAKEEAPVEQHRLTFMVGFWTRRVPDRMKEQKLYGPCGRIPPIQDEGATWVQAIHEGYNGISSGRQSHERCADVMAVDLPRVAPAWEEINRGQLSSSATTSTTPTTTDPPLEIPRAIDHRYFVADAPTCFRDSLFERDECDDGNAEDESSVEVDDDDDNEGK